MAYEALNNAGVMDSSLIVILNDNAMSISKDHGSMSQHLAKLRTSDKYTSFKHNLKNALRQIPGVGGAIANGLESVKDAVKYMVVPGVLFEELGFVYLGPVDGHSIQELIDVLQLAKSTKKPVLVHCMTKREKDTDLQSRGLTSSMAYPRLILKQVPYARHQTVRRGRMYLVISCAKWQLRTSV